MFRFADPQYLYLLLLVPLLALVYGFTLYRARKRWRRFGEPQILRSLVPEASRVRPHLKFVLLELTLALLVLMLARPQAGSSVETEKRKGIEAVITMDVSNSMLATDVTPNRLERAKMIVSNLIDKMKEDKIALQVFAGEAYPQLPVTNDYVSARMFLEPITPGMVSLQGTNLASAIRLAAQSFTQAKGVGKAIVVITDGEDHEEGAVEAAREAARQGLRVYVLGVGRPDGAEIPTVEGFLRDESGNVVRSCLNEDMCREVAEAGKGAYIHMDDTRYAQDKLSAELSKLQRAESEVTSYSAYDEQFQGVALLVLLLLLLEFFVMETRNPLFKHITLFQKRQKRDGDAGKASGRVRRTS